MGKLTLQSFHHDLVQMGGVIMMGVAALAVLFLLTYYRKWKWFYTEWLTSLDPKRIGIMYLTTAIVMLVKGLSDVVLIRTQQVMAVGDMPGLVSSDHFQQIFTAHGTSMIFFVGMGFIFGLMNLIVPLQIGARDVAFPFLNAASFWLFASGAILVNLSMVIGDFSACGWVAYPPLSGLLYSPGVGVDYWIWSVQIAGVGSLLAGINFWATIFKMRCPGMTLMNMPMFVWSVLASIVLVIFAFPILTATVGMLSLDRLLDMHFFTADLGGNPMMYVNLIWAWGHPEVYILILPAFGVFSEVVATFSHKRLFGYTSMVWAIVAIAFLSFIVWLHHFFTMGAGPNVNAFFGIMTMIIGVPTGVKVFNWLFTMCSGRVRFTTPILWFLGFVVIFTIGGMAGVLMSVAPADFQVHNSLFLVAHFHSMVIGGVLFGFFAAIAYWFPKYFGFTLNEKLGRIAAYFWIFGFVFAFTPLYFLGFMGATRRLDHYDAGLGWEPLFQTAAFGVFLVICGVGVQVLQVIVSVIQRKHHLDLTGDPWDGRTLEWATSSPPPEYNFATIPVVHGRDAFWSMKEAGWKRPSHAVHIEMPANTPLGFLIGVSSFFFGFGLIWHMFWMAALGLAAILCLIVWRLASNHTEEHLYFGFWTYLMTDCILFATLFVTYIVLQGGTSTKELFSLPYALTETFFLLVSSFTSGIAMLPEQSKRQFWFWWAVTFLLGAGFVVMEVWEFAHLIMDGNGPDKSGFFSGFFTLVGTHGTHVTIGLIWMLVLLVPVARRGMTAVSLKRLTCLRYFWHFLDVVWIFILSLVYLIGALK